MIRNVMDQRKRLIENIGSLFALQGASYILPLISMPYLMRVLGAEKFGLIVFAQAFTQYFVVLTDYGFNLTATRQIATHNKDIRKVSEVFCSVMVIKLALMLGSLLIMASIVFLVPKFRLDWPVYFIAYLTVVGNVLFPVWLFQGMEWMKYITLLNVSAKGIALLALFLLIHRPDDYLLAMGIQASGFVLAGLMGLWVARGRIGVRLVRPHLHHIRPMMREGLQVFTATLSGNVYGQGSVLITGLIAGDAAAGYYSLAQKTLTALSNLISPLAQGIYPRLTHMFNEGHAHYNCFRKKVFGIVMCIGILMSSALCLLSSPVSVLLSGHSSVLLNTLLKILGLAAAIDMLNVLMNTFILSMKRYAEMQKMYLFVAGLFLVVSIPVTYRYGPIGMAVSMLGIVEIAVLVWSIRISRLFAWRELGRHEEH